jgi:tetratricopeptide (TPR) repeat protein
MLAHVAGRYDEAERHYLEATTRLRRQGSLHADGFHVVALFSLRLSQDRVAELEPALAQLIAAYPLGADAWAIALAAQGRLDEARAARRTLVPIAPDYFTTFFVTLRAKAAVALGAVDEAPDLIAQLAPWSDQMAGALSTSLCGPPVAHTLGELYRLVRDHASAAAAFAEAEAVATRWDAPHWLRAARAERAGQPAPK